MSCTWTSLASALGAEQPPHWHASQELHAVAPEPPRCAHCSRRSCRTERFSELYLHAPWATLHAQVCVFEQSACVVMPVQHVEKEKYMLPFCPSASALRNTVDSLKACPAQEHGSTKHHASPAG